MNGLAFAAFFGFGALLDLFGANATALVETLAIDDQRLGLVGSMLSLGLGVGILLAGPLVDRAPRRPLFLSACAVVVVATTTVGPWTSFPSLLGHSAAIGIGAGFYETLLNAVVVERAGVQAGRRLLFIHSAATLGAAMTPIAVDLTRAPLELEWFDVFRLVGLLHVAIAALSFLVAMQKRKIPSHARAGPHAATARRDVPTLLAACLASFAYVGVESALTLFVARYAHVELGLELVRGGASISAFWIGLLVGRLAAGLSPRSPGAGSIAALSTAAGLVIAGFGLGWIPQPELAMAVTGFALGGAFPILIALAGTSLPGREGTAVGLAAGLGSLGGFVVPWLTGRIATATSLGTAFACLSLWVALMATAAGAARLRRPRVSAR